VVCNYEAMSKNENYLIIDFDSKLLSKSNFRISGKEKWGKLKDFEQHLAIIAKKNKPKNWDNGVYEGEFLIVITANSRVDVGNYSKSVLDALEGVIYSNDKNVKTVFTYLSAGADKNKVYIGISPTIAKDSIVNKLDKIQSICSEIQKIITI
jgi:Holliday junction resolvase RusA-like endonuclease